MVSGGKKIINLGMLMGMLPIIIIWRLWHRRSKVRMEAKMETGESVWISVRFWILKLLLDTQLYTAPKDDYLFDTFHLSVIRKQ